MNDLATEKQLAFIKEIVSEIGTPFAGTTKKEASKYISDHIYEYQHSRDSILSWAEMRGY